MRASERVDAAYQVLHRAIIEQALPPGTKLREEELAAYFGISRTLLRDALARLVGEGLVERLPRRSATVARPTLKEAEDAFALRHMLEREVVRYVASNWRPQFGTELAARIAEEEVARAAGDASVSIRLAGEFHLALARLSQNELVSRYLRELISRCSLILAIHGRPHSSECAVSEHREILSALELGDASAAVALMEHHISSVEERALLTADTAAELELSTVLSKYAAPAGTRRTRGPPISRATVHGKKGASVRAPATRRIP